MISILSRAHRFIRMLLSRGVLSFLAVEILLNLGSFFVPHAEAHIILIGGAGGIGDSEMLALGAELAAAEREIYRENRPLGCTVWHDYPSGLCQPGESYIYGLGYTLITSPTGPNWLLNPDWPGALAKLECEIEKYLAYSQAVFKKHPTKCPEFLHIIGFIESCIEKEAAHGRNWIVSPAARTKERRRD